MLIIQVDLLYAEPVQTCLASRLDVFPISSDLAGHQTGGGIPDGSALGAEEDLLAVAWLGENASK